MNDGQHTALAQARTGGAPFLWRRSSSAQGGIPFILVFGASTLQLTPGVFQVHSTGTLLWVGAPGQAGLLDLAASFFVAAVMLGVFRHRLAGGMEWVKGQ